MKTMLELKHLITLTTIRESRSLANASKILHLSLSALSHQMKDLENYYNCVFFIRKTNPVRFTSAGEQLLHYADQILPLFNEATRKLAEYSCEKISSFHVALECHSCYDAILPTLSEFRKLRPEIDIDFSAEFKFHPLPKLLTKELDLVITGDPIPLFSIEYTPLFDSEMLIGLSGKHPLAKKKFLLPEELTQETLITYPIEEDRMSIMRHFFKPVGLMPKKFYNIELTVMIIELVASGKGICCLPSWIFAEFVDRENLKAVRPGKKGIRETIYVAHRTEEHKNRYVQEFIRIAKTVSVKKLKGIELCP